MFLFKTSLWYHLMFFPASPDRCSTVYSRSKSEVGHRRWRVTRAGWCTGHARSRETDWPVLASKCENVKPFRCFYMFLHVFTTYGLHISVFCGEQSVRDFPFTQVGCAKAKRARHGPFNYPALRGQLVPFADSQVTFCFFTLDPSPRAIFSCVALKRIASCLVTTMWTVPWYADQAKCACMPVHNFLYMILCLGHRRITHELLMFVSSTDIWNIPNCVSLRHPRF